MATLIDTHRLMRSLKERGFDDRQAEGIVDALQEIDLDHVASKADIQDVRSEIQAVRTEIFALEAKLLKWIVPLLLGQIAVFAGIIKFVIG